RSRSCRSCSRTRSSRDEWGAAAPACGPPWKNEGRDPRPDSIPNGPRPTDSVRPGCAGLSGRIMRLRWFLPLLVLAAAGLGWFGLTATAAVRQGPLVVSIPPHEGLLGIANRLFEAQVIRSRTAFVAAT